MRKNIVLALLTVLWAAPSFAQDGALDVLDGETLYEDGWLLTAGFEVRTRGGLLSGADRIPDPLNRHEFDQAAVVSAHYGILNTLQAGMIIPYVSHSLLQGPGRLAAGGLGDVTLYAKWRAYRWDDVGKALNVSVLAGLELPTGRDDVQNQGVQLPADLQPGSASWDPFIGTAATYEPGRWRFNALALYKRVGEGSLGYKQGDQFFAELAAGNRFWLEPYPGPFMRADVMLRFRHEWADRQGGGAVADTGGELLTIGVNWAFRPQPMLDFQVSVEIPLYENVRGMQLQNQVAVFVAFGIRI